jgi:hypothetical protein
MVSSTEGPSEQAILRQRNRTGLVQDPASSFCTSRPESPNANVENTHLPLIWVPQAQISISRVLSLGAMRQERGRTDSPNRRSIYLNLGQPKPTPVHSYGGAALIIWSEEKTELWVHPTAPGVREALPIPHYLLASYSSFGSAYQGPRFG